MIILGKSGHGAVPNKQCLVLQQYLRNGHAFLDGFLWVATAAATNCAACYFYGWIKANAVHVLCWQCHVLRAQAITPLL